MNSPSRKEFY
jgi:hypothetical protein